MVACGGVVPAALPGGAVVGLGGGAWAFAVRLAVGWSSVRDRGGLGPRRVLAVIGRRWWAGLVPMLLAVVGFAMGGSVRSWLA